MTAVAENVKVAGDRAVAGQYLSFRLADQEYGLDILKVQEINRNLAATRIPRAAGHVRGVINLRGRIVPVIDLRRRFALPPRPDDGRTCNIVVRVEREEGTVTMGLVVDEVTEVRAVPRDRLSPPPELGSEVDASLITGIARLEHGIVVLLDVDRLVDTAASAVLADADRGERSDDAAGIS